MFKRYIKANGKEVNALRCELYYSLGGINYFTYKNESRGYYLAVSPVNRSEHMESYVGFSGVKKCLLEVTRQSKKAEAKAEEMVHENLVNLINAVCLKQNIELEEAV